MTEAARARPGVAPGLLLSLPAVVFLLAFFVGPLALNTGRSLETPDGLGIYQYARALGDTYYLGVLGVTIALSIAVTLATLVLGYPLALAIARSSGRTKSLLIFMIVTPLLINVVVRTFGWMIILGRSGVINAILKALNLDTVNIGSGWFAIWLALVHVLLPFMVLSIASTLEGIDGALEEAATTLGASPFRSFMHVVLPLSAQGVMTGMLLVFALSMGSFVTVMLMGSNATMVLPLLIYQQLNLASDWPFAAALGNILLITAIIVIAAQLRLAGSRAGR
ncbi:MAG: ABC transporter permease [Chelatococcus sp.]|uniref:ABC transporter permease n=1 Tax=unclassified Chelatococcus TaxID=2638111 RepID=UPI001BCC2E87|nr:MULTISPECIES: ABC transporter permease [unclassified Chelatococcus]CAH1649519.1 ABC transporter permease [Hyphomicrobiales bacterium]MBS7741753.1 ABC transporter permease [Chelatococcus sp. HY11]MBX3537709.1 ABC transporter permease [Chelatococcus sp.]MBX3541449.1 ABC transporter permease [Chelatococcus sp.]MCO5074657.1 ABC transporter permease [Chelatococcus sp.]